MNKRLLVAVVDDSDSVRESLPDLLQEFGFAAQAFASAEEFLASGPTNAGQIRCKLGATRDGKLSLDELSGGTFTITNGGVFGSLLSTPILSPPQVGILGMHTIKQRPIAVDGEVVIRPMMYLALSYDHRLIDGADAARFLTTIKQRLEAGQFEGDLGG